MGQRTDQKRKAMDVGAPRVSNASRCGVQRAPSFALAPSRGQPGRFALANCCEQLPAGGPICRQLRSHFHSSRLCAAKTHSSSSEHRALSEVGGSLRTAKATCCEQLHAPEQCPKRGRQGNVAEGQGRGPGLGRQERQRRRFRTWIPNSGMGKGMPLSRRRARTWMPNSGMGKGMPLPRRKARTWIHIRAARPTDSSKREEKLYEEPLRKAWLRAPQAE